MASKARGGKVELLVNGLRFDVKANVTYNLGRDRRESVVGQDGTHGYKLVPQQAYIAGTITDADSLDLAELCDVDDATVILRRANGKTIVLDSAWYAGTGEGSTEEGEFDFRFEAQRGREENVAG